MANHRNGANSSTAQTGCVQACRREMKVMPHSTMGMITSAETT